MDIKSPRCPYNRSVPPILNVNKQDADQLVGQAKRRPTKIRPKALGSGIVGRFSNYDKCRSEVACDIISGVAVDLVGADVRATCVGSGLNSERNIRLFARPDTFYPFCEVFNCILQPTGSNECRYIQQICGNGGFRQPCEIW